MDGLPAMSGIAAVVQEETSDQYLAGIWKGDLGRGLAWRNSLNSLFTDVTLRDRPIP